MPNRMLLHQAFARRILFAVAAIALPGLRAQPASHLRFEVASIKPVKGDVGKGLMQTLPGGGLRMGNVTLRGLISMAYGIKDEQITGGPSWISSQGYELLAKPENPEAADMAKSVAPGTEAWTRIEQRLQNLLADRFRLVIHINRKEHSGYTLVQARGGTKLTPSEHPEAPPGTMRSRARIDGRAGTMTMLASVLSNMLGSPVADRTGLTGNYDYKLEYAPDSSLGGGKFDPEPEPAPDPGRPSIFVALQEQLGLKLEPAKVAEESIVVDRAERPSN